MSLFSSEDELAPSLVFFSVPVSPIRFWERDTGLLSLRRGFVDAAIYRRCCGFSAITTLPSLLRCFRSRSNQLVARSLVACVCNLVLYELHPQSAAFIVSTARTVLGEVCLGTKRRVFSAPSPSCFGYSLELHLAPDHQTGHVVLFDILELSLVVTLFSGSETTPGGVPLFSPRRGGLRVPPTLLLAVEKFTLGSRFSCPSL